MFVIVQAWNNLPPDFVKNRGVPEAIGVALQHAVSLIPNWFSNKYILACFGTYTALSFTPDSVNTTLEIIRVMDILSQVHKIGFVFRIKQKRYFISVRTHSMGEQRENRNL